MPNFTRSPTVSGQFTINIKAGSTKLYNITINNSGGAYDSENNWCASFAPVQTTIKLRLEYTKVTVDGKDYMQTTVYVNNELKVTSKIADRYLATDANTVAKVGNVQFAENNKSGAGTFYVDNVKLVKVVSSAE